MRLEINKSFQLIILINRICSKNIHILFDWHTSQVWMHFEGYNTLT